AGVIAVDGRVRVRAATATGADRMAIRPYPDRFESDLHVAGDGVFRVRPIRPEDEPALTVFAREVDDRDLWHPSFALLRVRTHETTARLSQIDYGREMTLVAWQGDRVAGLARAVADPDFDRAECAVIIRADLRELGLATALLDTLTQVIKAQGVRAAMLVYPATLRQLAAISADLGFAAAPFPGDVARIAAVKQLT
ncbi:MAG: GNAT family N-acetyltransferase, partial [Proteobacteria bacterium]|nr:GNAT family N-acetyltransferase [Pseudomonadota bacterium]